MVAIEFIEIGSVPKTRHVTRNPQIHRQINVSPPNWRERNERFGFFGWLHLLALILQVGFFVFHTRHTLTKNKGIQRLMVMLCCMCEAISTTRRLNT